MRHVAICHRVGWIMDPIATDQSIVCGALYDPVDTVVATPQGDHRAKVLLGRVHPCDVVPLNVQLDLHGLPHSPVGVMCLRHSLAGVHAVQVSPHQQVADRLVQ